MSKSGNLVFKSAMDMWNVDVNDKPKNTLDYNVEPSFYVDGSNDFDSFDDVSWYLNKSTSRSLSQFLLKAYVKSKIAELKKIEQDKTYRFELLCSMDTYDSTAHGYGRGRVSTHINGANKAPRVTYAYEGNGTVDILDGFQTVVFSVVANENVWQKNRCYDKLEYRYNIMGSVDEAGGSTLDVHRQFGALIFMHYHDTDEVVMAAGSEYDGSIVDGENYLNAFIYEV